ncbi:uncharacterized protein B0T23DRAFT_382678 [Neurospora hispaniola]|uniref:Uncharacterized protein n=1 Tax=Neurospora hispaniola TaxID=588809 RepID=A0AAJ0I680_9PEZI|nr:hypothetical protein B0T23DRAFT_382678 [Neurospora hispaniola]
MAIPSRHGPHGLYCLVVQHRVQRDCLPGPSPSHAHHVYHVSGLPSFGIGMTVGGFHRRHSALSTDVSCHSKNNPSRCHGGVSMSRFHCYIPTPLSLCTIFLFSFLPDSFFPYGIILSIRHHGLSSHRSYPCRASLAIADT